MFELKSLTWEGMRAALEKANRYRLLNEPEQAEALRPPANDDALLRWNSCARMIMNHPDIAPADETTGHPAHFGD